MEVCCYNLESTLNAATSGADRIELCSDRHQGGVTPSYGTMEVVRAQVQLPIFVMIRPRGGDFLYSKPELDSMIYDIQMAKELEMDGVVMGVLQNDGQVDTPLMKELIDIARPLEVTFHRAFDLTPDAQKSLQLLITLGVDRILTSGQHTSVFDGIATIKSLIRESEGKLTVMPGAGITEANVLQILQQTGAREFHVSASGVRKSSMEFRKDKVLMGDSDSEYTVDVADKTRIRKFREIVDQLTINN